VICSVVMVSLVATAVVVGAAGPLLVLAKGSPIRVLGAVGNVAMRRNAERVNGAVR
jgi:hypothetical protein